VARLLAAPPVESPEQALGRLMKEARELPFDLAGELARRITEFVLIEGPVPNPSPPEDDRGRRFVSAIREVSDIVGRVPSSTDFLAEYRRRQHLGLEPLPSLSAVVKVFGGWQAALARAGLAPEPPLSRTERARKRKGRRIHRYPRERLIECLQAAARALAKPPTTRGYTAWRDDVIGGRRGMRPAGTDVPHFRTIENHFGSWTAALAATGFGDAYCQRARATGFSHV
jgi:hypothetical protein